MKLFATLGGLFASKSSVITRDLKRLNDLKPGLGDAAAAYVLKGQGETVLSTLGVVCTANPLEVGKPWAGGPRRDQSPSIARRKLIARGDPFDLEVMHRYAEVLDASCPTLPDQVAGSGAAPRAWRAMFTEALLGLPDTLNTWPRKSSPLNGRGMTTDAALALARRLGGDLIDVLDAIYTKGNQWAAADGALYREATDLAPLARAHPETFVAVWDRLQAPAKAELLQDLSKWELATSPPYLEFVVRQAGERAKSVHDAAAAALINAPADRLEALATTLLQTGDVDQRSGMVGVLARLGTPTARRTLEVHKANEKTARILSAIDTALSISGRQQGNGVGTTDNATSYIAIDGRRIEIPPLKPLASGSARTFGKADREVLRKAIAGANAKIRAQNEENARNGYKHRYHELKVSLADRAISMLNLAQERFSGQRNEETQFLNSGAGMAWMRDVLESSPDETALRLAMAVSGDALWALNDYASGPGPQQIRSYLGAPAGDLRHIDALTVANGNEGEFGNWHKRFNLPSRKGDMLRRLLQADSYVFDRLRLDTYPEANVWPYLAENFDVFDEAFGLQPAGQLAYDRVKAIHVLAALPATPERYFGPLLEAATATTKGGRAEARAMLSGVAEVHDRLLLLLDDSRQAARAGAAEWLGQRGDKTAVAPLETRLKKEKSESVKAAVLTALDRLGEDLSGLIGPSALIAEAEKGLKSTKLDKLAWLGLEHAPRLRFHDGSAAPADLVRWWAALAFKLKQPGGNALFSIYLDQLAPDDAAALSIWILESWMAYDTARPNDADANAYAKAGAQQRYRSTRQWIKDYTEEQAFADLKREFMSQYLNSGADSKGLLALATRAPSATAADRVRAYLKNHGSRTSQASALLEMLAGIGDPVALQVVIAAATRLKQKSVQKLAGELIERVAEARDWTIDELADRTIPSAGFDDDGVLALPCAEDGKVYEGRLGKDMALILRNPAGKDVAGLPSGQDDTTKASKKQLSTSRKELKQIVSMQSARLYEALCAERSWPADDWLRFFHQHPVMKRLIERLVWLGLDAEGHIAGSFRPTAEGDFSDATDEPVDPASFHSIRVAHGALLSDGDAAAWAEHLKDYEIKPLFVQFGRSLLHIAKDDAHKTEIDDRKGWLTDAFTIRGAASKLNYERGDALDGGFFNVYFKSFQSAGLSAVIEFTGNALPEENVPAALVSLRFERLAGPNRAGAVIKLGDVPAVLLSECWNDYHAMAAKAVFDAQWEKKAQW